MHYRSAATSPLPDTIRAPDPASSPPSKCPNDAHRSPEPELRGLFVYSDLDEFHPGLCWETSPYVCIPLPELSIFLPPARPLPLPNFRETVKAQPPFKSVPLPAQISGITEISLHPALRLECRETVVKLDFRLSEIENSVDAKLWEESATFPGLPSLTVISGKLPWPITAHASREWVTVGDALSAIWRALNIPIVEEDFDEWIEDHTAAPPLPKIGHKRKRMYSDDMTRMALLEGSTVFGGLTPSTMGCEVWEANFC
ncbi:hypothetical protein R3P38DRAFT_2657946 [Favolaschia claudopus]|uniref:DUF6699 domain-containing protein n=1 Tax=Favolaschia claudopus TaxID=2862362 RepID=A0AAV9ZUP9_9AGAR